DARRQLAALHAQRFGVSQQTLHFGIVTRIGAGFGIQSALAIVGADLLLQLGNLLPRIGERIGLTIERFHPMAAHTAPLIEQILGGGGGVGALRHGIVCVAHLAAGLGVLFMEQWVQPERILAVRLNDAGRSAAVAAVTRRATELVGIVDLQEFLARVTDKR